MTQTNDPKGRQAQIRNITVPKEESPFADDFGFALEYEWIAEDDAVNARE
jgi:hypothetical protein